MRPLSPSELLDAWERGLSEPPARRLLGVLAAASAAASVDHVATLSVGERDRRLLALREWTFGPRFSSVSSCPACRERLEWAIDASDLRSSPDSEPSADLSLEAAGYSVRFRLPNTLDLVAAAESTDLEAAHRLLLGQCLLEISHDGEPIAAPDIPADVAEAIAARMADTDRGAATDVELACPACGHHWAVLFDIESFFWSELSAWAQRILKDVHALARAYGWREADILRMGPWRREFYLSQTGP